jgi:hypothetical protein
MGFNTNIDVLGSSDLDSREATRIPRLHQPSHSGLSRVCHGRDPGGFPIFWQLVSWYLSFADKTLSFTDLQTSRKGSITLTKTKF